MSVHYQAFSHTDNSNLNLQFFFSNLGKISKKLITEVQRAQQTMWQELIQTDRERPNVRSDSLMVSQSLIKGKLSFSSKRYFLFS